MAALTGCGGSPQQSLQGTWIREGNSKGRQDFDWTRVVFDAKSLLIDKKSPDKCGFVGDVRNYSCKPQSDLEERDTWEDVGEGKIRTTDQHGTAGDMKYLIQGDKLSLTGTAGGYDGPTYVFDRKPS